jgi:hypothetical protein
MPTDLWCWASGPCGSIRMLLVTAAGCSMLLTCCKWPLGAWCTLVMLLERGAGKLGCLKSPLDRLRFTGRGGSSGGFVVCPSSESLSMADLGLDLSVPDVALAACWAAMSLREALPLFLRSLAYSQVRPNSTPGWDVSFRR